MKILKLSLIVLFVGLTSAVFAQTGQTPYLNSTQTYTITMEDGTNAADWIVADASGTPLASQPTAFMTETVDINVAKLVITWDESWATVSTGLPNFTIQFKETEGTNNCISVRSGDITVKGNTFFLIAGGNSDECHDKSGQVLAENATEVTEITYNVTLDVTTFALGITNWVFDLAIDAGAYTITEVKVDGASAITDYTGISVDGTKSTVPVVVKVSGVVTAAETVTLTVSNGKAIIDLVTTPDNGTGNKEQAITINALPNTSEISFN